MPFATRSDLLARGNARRLAQLAVPADRAMPAGEAALRRAVLGDDLSDLSEVDRESLGLALAAIDQALAEADELILSYGLPATLVTPLLTRLACTIALYFLQGAERQTDETVKAYEAAVATLKAHARGDLNLIPADPAEPVPGDDAVVVESGARRYGACDTAGGDW